MTTLITNMDKRLKKIEEIYMSIKREERTRKDLIKCGCPECTYIITILDQ